MDEEYESVIEADVVMVDVGVDEAVCESEVEVVGDAVAPLCVVERLTDSDTVELKDAETVTVILSETVALMVEHLQLG